MHIIITNADCSHSPTMPRILLVIYADASRGKYCDYSATESQHAAVRFAWLWIAEHVSDSPLRCLPDPPAAH